MSVIKQLAAWILFRNKKKSTVEATKESVSVRVLKRHIDILEEVNEGLSEQVSDLSKIASRKQKESMEEQVIKALINAFSPQQAAAIFQNPSSRTPTPTATLESGNFNYSDEDLKKQLALLDSNLIRKIAESPKEIVKTQAARVMPNMSDETVERVIMLSKEMIT